MVSDDRLCTQCRLYSEIEFWGGNQLRYTFPYHVITGVDVIDVFVHPHCRCRLNRLFAYGT